MAYRIEYWSNQSSNTNPMELGVSHGGTTTLLVRSNADAPGPSPVGKFQAILPKAQTDAFAEACRRLIAAPKPQQELPVPGELVRKLTVSLDGGPEEVRSTLMSTAPAPAFLAAEAVALTLVRATRGYPQVALAAQTDLRLNGAGRLEATIRITNVGKEPLSIPHPDLWNDGSVSIQVTALRNDVPLADLRDEHQQFLYLTNTQLRATLPTLSPGRTVLLAPRRDVTFQFAAELVLSRGGYDIWLTLDTDLLDAQGARVMRPELLSKRTQVRIR